MTWKKLEMNYDFKHNWWRTWAAKNENCVAILNCNLLNSNPAAQININWYYKVTWTLKEFSASADNWQKCVFYAFVTVVLCAFVAVMLHYIVILICSFLCFYFLSLILVLLITLATFVQRNFSPFKTFLYGCVCVSIVLFWNKKKKKKSRKWNRIVLQSKLSYFLPKNPALWKPQLF